MTNERLYRIYKSAEVVVDDLQQTGLYSETALLCIYDALVDGLTKAYENNIKYILDDRKD